MSALTQVAAAISMGAILVAPTHSVGPYRVALQDEAQWACLDKAGTPVVAVEEWQESDPYFSPAGKPIPIATSWRTEARQDWSAFGAARMFVSLVGERAATRALRKARGEDERRVAAMASPSGAKPGHEGCWWACYGRGSGSCACDVADAVAQREGR